MFELAGKIAIVTGGSRGIGRAISVALARAGAHVLINYRSNEEAATETLRLIEAAGGRGELLGFDVADPESVDRAIKTAIEQ
ncbi:MAG: SDR family NAD(P)-dependent oxidoreductase, partial [Myxococcales bacterium]|nr:SDR family NAD(P)-dependent oxidoreductase [Myxococcales bacterium]